MERMVRGRVLRPVVTMIVTGRQALTLPSGRADLDEPLAALTDTPISDEILSAAASSASVNVRPSSA
jgi:hypothetical protein